MRATADDYYRALLARRPNGPAWAEEDDLLRGVADELARAHNRALDTLGESDPRSAYEMLAAWERNAGLPDPCTTGAESVAERQLRLHQKITSRGGQSRDFFIALAETLGYLGATISEFRPFTAVSACEDSLDPDPWRFVWRLDLPQSTRVVEMTADSACDDALRVWGDTTLECVITRLKPAHTHIMFGYGVSE